VEVARFVAFLAGVVIVVGTVWNLFTALVLPRVTSSRILRGIARMLGGSARLLSPRLPTYELRDRLLSFVGPASIVLLFGLWIWLILFGFSLIIWWDSGIDYWSALGVAGSSTFTLGIVTTSGAGPHTLEIFAAGFGLLVLALEIAYLPALYNAFAVRETEVTLLAARGGSPAWGPEILARHFWLDTMDELPPLYAQWERWAAAVSESHANYPGLVWFRSPVSTRSWLLGLVAMMDAAALQHAASPANTPHQARLCLSMGFRCLRSIANAWRIPFDADPQPDARVRLTRGEFEDGYGRLAEINFPLERDIEETWRHFQGWRVNYEPIVDALTVLIVPPPAPWFIARPELVGPAMFPLVINRTPDEPAGAKGYGKTKTFNTPSVRESKSS
jgi:hypothetical protein